MDCIEVNNTCAYAPALIRTLPSYTIRRKPMLIITRPVSDEQVLIGLHTASVGPFA